MWVKKLLERAKNIYTYSTGLEKAYLVFINLIRLTLIVALVSSIINQNWWTLLVTILAFILTFLPYIFEVSYNIDLPAEFEIITVLVIYGSIFLGEVYNYYYLYWWWDLFLHAFSALALGFFGFTTLYVLYRANKIQAKPLIVAFFSFSFALAIGALWEIFEFTMDQTLGTNMQKSGLMDTMADLIIDSAGAFIASFVGYLYLKKRNLFIFNKVMKRFMEQNPQLFESEDKIIKRNKKIK